jgi:translation initiation factor IF-1
MMLARRSLLKSTIFYCVITGILSANPIDFTQIPENLYLTGVSGIRPNGSLHCVAECADPECNPVSYTWLHNGEVLSENTSSRRIYGNGTISILKVTSSVSGWYQCRAMAGGGNWGIFTAPVEVKKVVFKNKFIFPPKSRDVPRNNPAILQCQPYKMTPPAIISWSFKGSPLQTSSLYRVLSHGDLLIQQVNKDSVGKYKCFATNPVTKQSTSAAARLSIADGSASLAQPSQMSLKHRNMTVNVGDNVTIDCIPHADRRPSRVIWRHNGKKLLLPEKSYQWCLNLGPTQVEHEGLYECDMEFEEMSFRVSVNLTVQGMCSKLDLNI